jgi:hypothetical protein
VSNISALLLQERVRFLLDNDVYFVLDQHTYL